MPSATLRVKVHVHVSLAAFVRVAHQITSIFACQVAHFFTAQFAPVVAMDGIAHLFTRISYTPKDCAGRVLSRALFQQLREVRKLRERHQRAVQKQEQFQPVARFQLYDLRHSSRLNSLSDSSSRASQIRSTIRSPPTFESTWLPLS